LWRRRSLRQRVVVAYQALGERIYQLGQGDAQIRARIAAADNGIRGAKNAMQPTRVLIAERDRMITQLGGAAVAAPSAWPGAEREYWVAKDAATALQKQGARLHQRLIHLFPNSPQAWRRVCIGYGMAVALLILISRGNRPTAAEGDDHARQAAADALLLSEERVWTLEGQSLKDTQKILASSEAKTVIPQTGEKISDLVKEQRLRVFLRSKRPASLLIDARSFLECLDPKSKSFLADVASKTNVEPAHLLLEWLTYESAIDLGMMTTIWQQGGNFKGEASAVVNSFFEGVYNPPSTDKGVEVVTKTHESIIIRLFGAKVIEEIVSVDPIPGQKKHVRVRWKSNYNYLRDILKGGTPRADASKVLRITGTAEHFF
jgi:hypothetical protein